MKSKRNRNTNYVLLSCAPSFVVSRLGQECCFGEIMTLLGIMHIKFYTKVETEPYLAFFLLSIKNSVDVR